MRAALLLSSLLLSLLVGVSPAGAEDWIALWTIGGSFFGMTENGCVYEYDPATGHTELTGSFGEGHWVSFGRRDDRLLALESGGQVWAMPASTGVAELYWTFPGDHEWCALQQHPDNLPTFAISCDGEIWRMWDPLEMLADMGQYATGRWISVANSDDSFFATLESGDTWQGMGDWFQQSGTFGPGPWTGFSRTYGMHGNFIALKPNGEIWEHGWNWDPELFLALPADREWCALLTGPVFDAGPGYALTCAGEIWSVESPPALVGTFALPTPVEERTWGGIKAVWR